MKYVADALLTTIQSNLKLVICKEILIEIYTFQLLICVTNVNTDLCNKSIIEKYKLQSKFGFIQPTDLGNISLCVTLYWINQLIWNNVCIGWDKMYVHQLVNK